jgi:RNA polymerase sigma factor (sigma-70 family)
MIKIFARMYSDDYLLMGLRDQDPRCIRFMFRNYFPIVRALVYQNSGTLEDAEDVFQDVLIILYKKVRAGPVVLNCTLKTFFYSLSRNIWKQRLDRKWRLHYTDILSEPEVDYETVHFDLDEEWLEKVRLYHTHFLRLPNDCQRVLILFYQKKTFRDIAMIMGFSSHEYAKVRKYLCKKMLRKRIMKDPHSKNLFII